jgi:hypothetical protein
MKLGLRLAPLLLVGCSWLTPSHGADVIKLLGCALTESVKVAPNRMPTWEEASVIAFKCGAEDADAVIDMVSAHRVASRLELGK